MYWLNLCSILSLNPALVIVGLHDIAPANRVSDRIDYCQVSNKRSASNAPATRRLIELVSDKPSRIAGRQRKWKRCCHSNFLSWKRSLYHRAVTSYAPPFGPSNLPLSLFFLLFHRTCVRDVLCTVEQLPQSAVRVSVMVQRRLCPPLPGIACLKPSTLPASTQIIFFLRTFRSKIYHRAGFVFLTTTSPGGEIPAWEKGTTHIDAKCNVDSGLVSLIAWHSRSS